MMCRIILPVILASSLTLLAAETGPKKANEIKEKIRTGILNLRQSMQSNDEKTRIATMSSVLCDQALSKKLFGEDAKYLKELLEKGLTRMLENTSKIKEEFERQGAIKTIGVTDVRASDVSGRFRKVLTVIPKEIPIYIAVVKGEKGSAGSSSYLLVDGKFRYVPGLESMHEFISKAKAEKKSEK